MKCSIALVICASLIGSYSVEASLKMKAMGFWNRNHHTPKPWDGESRSRVGHQYDDYEQVPATFQEETAQATDQASDAPCVGMCYYKKIMGLEEKENEEKMHNEVIENEPAPIAKDRKPCVGLCHYYRTLGIENPFEKRPLKRFPDMN